jgi:hypothetical protein
MERRTGTRKGTRKGTEYVESLDFRMQPEFRLVLSKRKLKYVNGKDSNNRIIFAPSI